MDSSSSGSGAASVATRGRTEEKVGGSAKKSKQEASPPKVITRKSSKKPGVLSKNLTILFQTQAQAPKVKLGEKITALQQIVSPFGKVQPYKILTAKVLLQMQAGFSPFILTRCELALNIAFLPD